MPNVTVKTIIDDFMQSNTAAEALTVLGIDTVLDSLGSMADQDANSVSITGGSINGVDIGTTTARTGAFTTLSTSGILTVNGGHFSGIDVQSGGVPTVLISPHICKFNIAQAVSFSLAPTSLSGVHTLTFTPDEMVVRSGWALKWNSSNNIMHEGVADTVLLRDSSNTIALRNGVNAQALRVYKTYSDASNYERGVVDWSTTTDTLTIGTQNSGTGVGRGVNFVVGGTPIISLASSGSITASYTIFANGGVASHSIQNNGANDIVIGTANAQALSLKSNNVIRWNLNSSGHLLATTDNIYDIGAIGASRPRVVYSGAGFISGNGSNWDIGGTDSSFGRFGLAFIKLATNSVVLFNENFADAAQLAFGGTASTFPAIKRVGAGLEVRLADDSAFGGFAAGAATFSSLTVNGVAITTNGGGGGSTFNPAAPGAIGETTPAAATFTTVTAGPITAATLRFTATTVAFTTPLTPNVDTTSHLIIGTIVAALTINPPSAATYGRADKQMLWFDFTQNSTGYPITFDTGTNGFDFGTDITSADIPSTANAKFEVGARWDAASSKWRIVALIRGF